MHKRILKKNEMLLYYYQMRKFKIFKIIYINGILKMEEK